MKTTNRYVHHTCCSPQTSNTNPPICPNTQNSVSHQSRTPRETTPFHSGLCCTRQVGTAVPASFIITRPLNGEMPTTILTQPTGYTNVDIWWATSSGAIIGNGSDANGNSHGLVWASASAQPTILAQPVGETHVQVSGVTATGIMYGSGTDMLGVTQVLTWSSSTAHPTIIDPPTGATAKQVQAVGAGGTIVISATNSSGVVSSFVAKP